MDKLKGFNDYVKGVLNGTIPTGDLVKKAVKRHQNDLKTAKKKGFYFDEDEAYRQITFFTFLSHSKGEMAGQDFKPEPWQEFAIGSIFGWKKIKTGKRRFSECYLEVAKKNGKTFLASGIGLYGLVGDREGGSNVYACAYTRDQANLCFKEARQMVIKSDILKSKIGVYANSLVVEDTASSFSAVSNDAKNTEGKNSHFAIVDEYHVHTTDDLLESVQSGMASRSQPLLFIITTAGFKRSGPCYAYRRNIVNILEGKVDMDHVFGLIYTLDEGDDWTDPKNWHKANPNLGVSVNLEFLEQQYAKAKMGGTAEVNFKTKHLNMWVGSADTWINDEYWMDCFDDSPQNVSTWYGGLDLANTKDYTAFSLIGKNDLGKFVLKTWYWICEDQFNERFRAMPDLMKWKAKGWVKVAGSNVIDKSIVKADILQLFEEYNFHSIAYDSWGFYVSEMQELAIELPTIEINNIDECRLMKMDQTPKVLGAPTKEFECVVLDGDLVHDGNPVTRWMLGNVVLYKDGNGNIKCDKAKSSEKIDGVVASIMALGQYLTFNYAPEEGQSIYETQPVFII